MLWTPDSNAYEALGYRLTFIRSENSATDLAVSSQMAGKSHETEIKRTAAARPQYFQFLKLFVCFLRLSKPIDSVGPFLALWVGRVVHNARS